MEPDQTSLSNVEKPLDSLLSPLVETSDMHESDGQLPSLRNKPPQVIHHQKPKETFSFTKIWNRLTAPYIHAYRMRFDKKYFSDIQWEKYSKNQKPDQENVPFFWDKLTTINKERFINTYFKEELKKVMVLRPKQPWE